MNPGGSVGGVPDHAESLTVFFRGLSELGTTSRSPGMQCKSAGVG